jgi:hypothetical protein
MGHAFVVCCCVDAICAEGLIERSAPWGFKEIKAFPAKEKILLLVFWGLLFSYIGFGRISLLE